MTNKKRKKPRKTAANSDAKPHRPGDRLMVKNALAGDVTAAELSEIFGVTDQTLRVLAKDGMPKGSRGKYPLRDASRFYLAKLRKRAEEPADGPTRADIDRQLAQIKLKQAMGGLIDRQEVLDTVTGASARLAKHLETLATSLGREFNLPGDDVKLIQQRVDEMRAAWVRETADFQDVVEDGDAAKVA